jgi:hypothetical protein
MPGNESESVAVQRVVLIVDHRSDDGRDEVVTRTLIKCRIPLREKSDGLGPAHSSRIGFVGGGKYYVFPYAKTAVDRRRGATARGRRQAGGQSGRFQLLYQFGTSVESGSIVRNQRRQC